LSKPVGEEGIDDEQAGVGVREIAGIEQGAAGVGRRSRRQVEQFRFGAVDAAGANRPVVAPSAASKRTAASAISAQQGPVGQRTGGWSRRRGEPGDEDRGRYDR
jgi:hypothetical protein